MVSPIPTPERNVSPNIEAILESTSPTTGSVTNQMNIGYEFCHMSAFTLFIKV